MPDNLKQKTEAWLKRLPELRLGLWAKPVVDVSGESPYGPELGEVVRVEIGLGDYSTTLDIYRRTESKLIMLGKYSSTDEHSTEELGLPQLQWVADGLATRYVNNALMTSESKTPGMLREIEPQQAFYQTETKLNIGFKDGMYGFNVRVHRLLTKLNTPYCNVQLTGSNSHLNADITVPADKIVKLGAAEVEPIWKAAEDIVLKYVAGLEKDIELDTKLTFYLENKFKGTGINVSANPSTAMKLDGRIARTRLPDYSVVFPTIEIGGSHHRVMMFNDKPYGSLFEPEVRKQLLENPATAKPFRQVMAVLEGLTSSKLMELAYVSEVAPLEPMSADIDLA